MLKQINNYVFNSTNGTITFTDFVTIELENIKSIVNVTRSKVLFNQLNPELLGSVANNVLTIDISTSGMSSNDDLAIMYETNDNFATNEAQEDILESVDGLEGIQGTTNSLLTDIKAFFTNTYNQVTNWIAVKVINFPNDYSTSAKQDTTNNKIDSTNSKLDTLNSKDFATETTLDGIKDFFTNIYNQVTNWLAVKVINFPNDYSTSANQTNGNQKVQLIDSDGNNLVTEDNILRIHDTPHSAPELSVHLTQDTATQSTLSVQANKGSRDIVLVSATGFATNNRIKIIDGANGENDILKVLAVNGNTLTLDRVLDADQTAGRVVKKVLINMAVDGSTTEQIFSYKPRTGENKRITSINISITTTGEPSPEKFGGITALTRGVHMRVKNATGRDQTYFIPFRSNSSFELSDFDYVKELKVGGGEYTTFLKSTFYQKMDSIIPLDDTQEFQVIIQDNLGTGITSFECKLSMYDESGVVI